MGQSTMAFHGPRCGHRWEGAYGLEACCVLDAGHQPPNKHRGLIVDVEAFWQRAAEKYGQEAVDAWRKRWGQNSVFWQLRDELVIGEKGEPGK